MSVMFVTRLHKAIKNDQGKHPVVLQITWERNVRRKRTGIWARPNQLFVDDDGKARLREIDGKKLKQKKLDLMQRMARRVYEDHYEDEEFDYGEFCRILDETLDLKKAESREKKMMVAQFSNLVADNFEKSGQVRSAMDYRVLSALILKVSPKDIYFSEFTVDWLKKLEAHFNRKETRGYNYMNLLKVLYNKAVQARQADYRKVPFKNPYTNPYGYDISKLKKRRIAKVNTSRIKDLSIEQIKQLRSYDVRNEKE